jgi:hypothetical protein
MPSAVDGVKAKEWEGSTVDEDIAQRKQRQDRAEGTYANLLHHDFYTAEEGEGDAVELMPPRKVNTQQLLALFRDLALQLLAELHELGTAGLASNEEGASGASSPAMDESVRSSGLRRKGMSADQKREVLSELLYCFSQHLPESGQEHIDNAANLDAVQQRLRTAVEMLPGRMVGGIVQVAMEQPAHSQTRQLLVMAMRTALTNLGPGPAATMAAAI